MLMRDRSFSLGRLRPRWADDVFIADGATIVGDVQIDQRSSVWFGCVIRGDNGLISIGKESNAQDLVVIHGLPGNNVKIGDHVSIGHHAVLHGCTIADRCLIGMQSLIMDGAEISEDTIVGGGTLVPMGKKFPPGVLLLGSPARLARALTDREIAHIRENADQYTERAAMYRRELASIRAESMDFEGTRA